MADYLQFYRTQRAELLKSRGGLVNDHPEPVATTWSLSFTQVETRSAAAADLLRVCSFLHPDAIPEEIITEGAAELGPNLQAVEQNSLVFNHAIGVLLSYSLLKRQPEEHLLSMHRLVQAVLKDGMSVATYQQWAERVVQAVETALPDEVDYGPHARYERCLPHARECAQLIEQEQLTSYSAKRLLQQIGRYLWEHARYAEAEAFFQQCLLIIEQDKGFDHLEIAYPLIGLAVLYSDQGKNAEAEPSYQRALKIMEQALGPDHPDVAPLLNNLAALYAEQGKYTEAEPLYQRALHIREQAYGPDHPRTRDVMGNYAILLREMGEKLKRASWKRGFLLPERSTSTCHPDIALVILSVSEESRTPAREILRFTQDDRAISG